MWVMAMRFGLACFVVGGVSALLGADLTRARELYQRTEYRQVLSMLQQSPQDPEMLLLAGKSAFMLGDFKKSTDLLERATTIDSGRSEYFHWLGKALGRRAETASFLTAPKLAVECRKAFERAVELNPSNVEALNDLFEYYLEAPGFLGGGLDKASEAAARIGKLDPVEQHYVSARLAEKRKDFNSAEQHLRRASELAPQQIGRIVDLAKFLSKHGQIAESEAVFAKADKVAPNNPKVMFERAQTYIEGKRNLDKAKQLLQQYLKANVTPDDPPKTEAEKMLRQVSGA
ncbi:MAG: hypothetical protein IT168_29895 [Bryobacterales bacterium]|nr:hypothetical protein [Bryobacterales bacterium]